MLVEHARNLIGLIGATHDEYGADDGPSVISALQCSLQGVDIEIELSPGTNLARLYGADRATEHATCSFGLDVGHQRLADESGMRVGAIDETGEVRAVERPDHPFFVATLYQPQLRSRPRTPHPVFAGLVAAAAR